MRLLNTVGAAALMAALGVGVLPAQAQVAPGTGPATAPASPPPAAPPAVLPLSEAVLRAAGDLFSKAQLPAGDARIALVIDPLVDGVSGSQSAATRDVGVRISELVAERFPRFELKQFNAETVASKPVVLVGTFTAINNAGQLAGPRDAFRVCLGLADLNTGRMISKGVARAAMAGVDTTPTTYFRDAPAWNKDPSVEAYIKTCQGTKVGDPIDPAYAARVQTAALVTDAIKAYEGGAYQRSLDLYQTAQKAEGGEQLRVLNGLVLANLKLGRRRAMADAFGDLVEKSLEGDRLAVKFLFRPGTTRFVSNPQLSGNYQTFMAQIGLRAQKKNACLDVVGHTSKTGPEPVNERLSLARAETIRRGILSYQPKLAAKLGAAGKGSQEALIGTGRDDASDALDRRVEFKVKPC